MRAGPWGSPGPLKHGHERRFRGGDRGRGNDGAGWHGVIWGAEVRAGGGLEPRWGLILPGQRRGAARTPWALRQIAAGCEEFRLLQYTPFRSLGAAKMWF